MKKILTYQKAFLKAILANDYKRIECFTDRIDNLEDRFNIYLSNVFSSLKKVLKDDFPYCAKILGTHEFNQASFEFVRNFPPTSGCLLDYGKKFPLYLKTFFPNFPYLYDIGRIEWAKKELYFKENSISLDPDLIKKIPSHEYSGLRFVFHKAAFFLESSYLLENILKSVEINKLDVKNQNLGSSYLLIIRPKFKVELFWINAAEFYFLRALYEKKTLEEAFEYAMCVNSRFNLSEVLTIALKREYFQGVSVCCETRKII